LKKKEKRKRKKIERKKMADKTKEDVPLFSSALSTSSTLFPSFSSQNKKDTSFPKGIQIFIFFLFFLM